MYKVKGGKMIKERREKQTCTACNKEFMVVWKTYPSKLDDKRDSYYHCPYCNEVYEVRLLGNEDVESEKID